MFSKQLLLLVAAVFVCACYAEETEQDEFMQDAVMAHNLYRRIHGVPPIKLNVKLSEVALNRAKELAKLGSLNVKQNAMDGKNLGETVGSVGGFASYNGISATQLWYSVVSKFDEEGEMSAEGASFTQIIWKSTQEAGFGVAKGADGKFYFVGEYFPSGNIRGQYDENVSQLTDDLIDKCRTDEDDEEPKVKSADDKVVLQKDELTTVRPKKEPVTLSTPVKEDKKVDEITVEDLAKVTPTTKVVVKSTTVKPESRLVKLTTKKVEEVKEEKTDSEKVEKVDSEETTTKSSVKKPELFKVSIKPKQEVVEKDEEVVEKDEEVATTKRVVLTTKAPKKIVVTTVAPEPEETSTLFQNLDAEVITQTTPTGILITLPPSQMETLEIPAEKIKVVTNPKKEVKTTTAKPEKVEQDETTVAPTRKLAKLLTTKPQNQVEIVDEQETTKAIHKTTKAPKVEEEEKTVDEQVITKAIKKTTVAPKIEEEKTVDVESVDQAAKSDVEQEVTTVVPVTEITKKPHRKQTTAASEEVQSKKVQKSEE